MTSISAQQVTNQFLIEVQGLESEKRDVERQLQQEKLRVESMKELLQKEQAKNSELSHELSEVRNQSSKLKADFVMQEKQLKQVKDSLKIAQGNLQMFQDQDGKRQEDMILTRNSFAGELRELTNKLREMQSMYRRNELVRAKEEKEQMVIKLKYEVNTLRAKLGMPQIQLDEKDTTSVMSENSRNNCTQGDLEATVMQLRTALQEKEQELMTTFKNDIEEDLQRKTDELQHCQTHLERHVAMIQHLKQIIKDNHINFNEGEVTDYMNSGYQQQQQPAVQSNDQPMDEAQNETLVVVEDQQAQDQDQGQDQDQQDQVLHEPEQGQPQPQPNQTETEASLEMVQEEEVIYEEVVEEEVTEEQMQS